MKGQQMTRRNFCWFTDSGMFNDGFRNRFEAEWEAPSDEAVDWLDDVAEDDFNELGQMMQRTFNRWIRKHPEYKLDFFEVENVRGVELHEANL